jgi:putative PIN family toxin of toxin-antitoxin system
MNPESIMRADRFVLDNNIWVSYLITRKEQKLIDIIADNDLTVFACDELFAEIRRVLNYPHLNKYDVDISYALKVVKGATVHYSIAYPIKRYIPLDENDNYLVGYHGLLLSIYS